MLVVRFYERDSIRHRTEVKAGGLPTITSALMIHSDGTLNFMFHLELSLLLRQT